MARVYKRGNRWGVDYTEVDGRRVRRMVADHKAVAQLVLADIKSRVERQKWGLPSGPEKKTTEFIDEFLTHIKADKSPKTAAWYEHKLLRFAKFIGQKSLSRVLPKDIADFKIERLKEAKAATVAGDLRTLNLFFNQAIKWGRLERNPCRSVSKPRMIAKNPPGFLSKNEVGALLKTAKDSPIYPMVATALYAGLRFEELTRLEWQDINFEQGLISVKSKEEGHTKSHRARSIPLHPALRSVFNVWKRKKGYCFEADGKKRTYSAYRALFKSVAKGAGLGTLGWHTLRHTFASHLVMAGVDLATVKELLGHSSITTTMIYAHLAPEHLRGAVERLSY